MEKRTHAMELEKVARAIVDVPGFARALSLAAWYQGVVERTPIDSHERTYALERLTGALDVLQVMCDDVPMSTLHDETLHMLSPNPIEERRDILAKAAARKA